MKWPLHKDDTHNRICANNPFGWGKDRFASHGSGALARTRGSEATFDLIFPCLSHSEVEFKLKPFQLVFRCLVNFVYTNLSLWGRPFHSLRGAWWLEVKYVTSWTCYFEGFASWSCCCRKSGSRCSKESPTGIQPRSWLEQASFKTFKLRSP